MLSAALRATNPSKTPFQAAASKELLHRPRHDGPQRSGPGLEAFLVCPDVAVKMVLEELVKSSSLRMSWSIVGRPIRNGPPTMPIARTATITCGIGVGNDRIVAEGHGRQLTSGGFGAALDQTARGGYMLTILGRNLKLGLSEVKPCPFPSPLSWNILPGT